MRITIAKVDNPGCYENDGVIAFIEDGKMYMTDFFHCSCYDTWESVDRQNLTGYDIDELVKCAKEKIDTDIHVLVEDSDTLECYRQIVEWDAKGRPMVDQD